MDAPISIFFDPLHIYLPHPTEKGVQELCPVSLPLLLNELIQAAKAKSDAKIGRSIIPRNNLRIGLLTSQREWQEIKITSTSRVGDLIGTIQTWSGENLQEDEWGALPRQEIEATFVEPRPKRPWLLPLALLSFAGVAYFGLRQLTDRFTRPGSAP